MADITPPSTSQLSGAYSSLTDMLGSAYIATLNAEKQGMVQYLDILKELDRMDPLLFYFMDDAGERRMLSIPVLTLVPLSMLHIEEAEFDFAVVVETVDRSSETQAPDIKNNYTEPIIERPLRDLNPVDPVHIRGVVRQPMDARRRIRRLFSETRKPQVLPKADAVYIAPSVRPSVRPRPAPQETFRVSLDASKATTTNLKVKVKMKQSSLPEGVLEVLQSLGNANHEVESFGRNVQADHFYSNNIHTDSTPVD